MAELEKWAKENSTYLFWGLVIAIIIIIIMLMGAGMNNNNESMTAGGNQAMMQGYFAGGRQEAFRARRDIIEGMNGNGQSGVTADPRGANVGRPSLQGGLVQNGLTLQEQLELEGRQQVLDRLGCGPDYVATAPTEAWGWLRRAAYEGVPPEEDWAQQNASDTGPEGFYGAHSKKKERMDGGLTDKNLTKILAGAA